MNIPFEDFLRCWMDLLSRKAPPPDNESFDFAGFELALTDLAGEHFQGQQADLDLERLGDALIHLSESLVEELQRDLASDQTLAVVGPQVASLFRKDAGSSYTDPEIRSARRDACARLVKLLEINFGRVMARREHALRMRRARRARHQVTDPEILDSSGVYSDPTGIALVREGSQRVVSQMKTDLAPAVFAFLRASLLTPGFVASKAAQDFGCSPAALSRARKRLEVALRTEYSDLDAARAALIQESLSEAFRAA